MRPPFQYVVYGADALLIRCRLAEYLESSANRDKTALAEAKERLAAIERELGFAPGSNGDGNAEAGPSNEDLAAVARKRHRFDDHEYLEESREINDTVRNAVTAGLLKKRKKAKATEKAGAATTTTASSSSKAAEAVAQTSKEAGAKVAASA